jgi:hypothetical protein
LLPRSRIGGAVLGQLFDRLGWRPINFYRRGGTCERPYVKDLTIMVNSIFNSWRMEDVWLDK